MRVLLKIVLAVFAAAVLVFGIALPFSLRAFSALKEAEHDLLVAKDAFLVRKDFMQVAASLQEAAQDFERAHAALSKMQYLKVVPWVRVQFTGALTTTEAAEAATRGLTAVSQFVGEVWEPLALEGSVRIGDIPEKQRRAIFAAIEKELPALQQAAVELERAEDLLNSILVTKIIHPFGKRVELLSQGVRLGKEFIIDALPLLKNGVNLLGYPEPKTYLLILQNSDELRPSGGFIGTYGLVTFDSGHITQFFTDDVYNLDRFSSPDKRPLAPAPLARYLEQARWYLRDANWDPDFPTSARRVMQFYQEETHNLCQQRKVQPIIPNSCFIIPDTIDGVIAVMPEAMRSLLKIIGPLTVENQTFSADNLTDALEYEVEVGFVQKGIPRPQRKAIIAALGHEFISKILSLPPTLWPEVVHAVRTALDEKQFLIYAQDPMVQKALIRSGWGGQLRETPSDFLAVFDANLFSLKTDPYVSREIFYRVNQARGGHLVSEVEIVYTYPKAGPAWKTKGYRSFTRVYVPKGSVLVSASGAMEAEFSRAGQVEISQEFDKTVFGAFVAVQVGEVKRLRFTYRLPEQVVEQSQTGAYNLLVQKQPGTLGHGLTVALDFGKVPRQWDPTGLGVARQGSAFIWRTSLRRDQTFRIVF